MNITYLFFSVNSFLTYFQKPYPIAIAKLSVIILGEYIFAILQESWDQWIDIAGGQGLLYDMDGRLT